MTLEIIEFINQNSDWEEILTGMPYFVKTKREGDLVLLKYDQINSDFNSPIVRECRGIILDEADGHRPVCVPFFKFGNFGESYVLEIDWTTARIQEKVDGSLIKLWYYKGEWRVSSNGEIDARNAHVSCALLSERSDLYSLFMEAWNKTNVNMDTLSRNNTYMFELTSPYNRVVVKHDETTIRHIGTRNNETMTEHEIDIGIQKPRVFTLGTLDECIMSAKNLGYNEEGYVVVDQCYNRIKIKSPHYVMLSHLIQGVTTHAKIVEIIQKNERDEFLTYFPEYRKVFDEISCRIDEFSEKQTNLLLAIQTAQYASRKELAATVTKTECPACLFALIDGKSANARNWLMARPPVKVLELISFSTE